MAKTVWVDEEACISCGICVETVPEVFRFADNGKAEAYDQGGGPEERIQGAIDSCPVACIYWQE